MRPGSRLNTFANITLVVASIALGASVWHRFAQGRARPKLENPFRIGMKAPQIPGVDYRSYDRTLVLFLRTGCQYCESSAPFYNELHRLTRNQKQKWHVVSVFPDMKEQVEQFRQRTTMTPEAISGQDLGRFQVRVTPTAVLVTSDGTIAGSWLGSSQPNHEEITAAVGH